MALTTGVSGKIETSGHCLEQAVWFDLQKYSMYFSVQIGTKFF